MLKSHTVKAGDTLSSISVKYYGAASRWTMIRDANPQLAVRKKAVDGSPLIYPGDTLIIPDKSPPAETNTAASSLVRVIDKRNKLDISIRIDGKTFTGFTGYRIAFPVDSFDSFSFSAPFDDTVKDLRSALKPFAYKSCTVSYDGTPLFDGTLLTPNPAVTPDSKTITIEGYPLCGVINDVCLPVTKFPPQYDGLKLSEIASDMCGPFGLDVAVQGGEGSAFNDVAYEPDQTIYDFLTKLAEQRGLLITNNAAGALLFWKPKEEKASAAFCEGELPFVSCVPSFDAQKFYSHVTGFTKVDDENDSLSFTYENTYLINAGVLRPFSFMVDDATDGDLEDAVKSKAARMIAGAVFYTLTVTGHKDKNGNLYRKNMCVTVKSPGAMIYRETKLLVDSVEFSRSDKDGNLTVFKLVLPGSRSGKLPEAYPWEE